jgi:ABC-type proline/glycine betaine transport system permease subunit
VLARLKILLGGFLLAALTLGTLVAAVVVGSVIALVLWVAVVIVLVAVIMNVAFRQALRKRAPESREGASRDVDH